MTIEHFSRHATEAAARTACPAYVITNDDGSKAWAPSVCPFRVFSEAPGPNDTDGNPTIVRTYAPGFYLRISLPAQDDALAALSQSFVTDSVERGIAKATTILTRKGFTPAQIAAFKIEPELLGVKNPNE